MYDRLLGITEYFLLCAVGYAAAMFLSCHTLTCKNHFGSAYVNLSFYLHFERKTFSSCLRDCAQFFHKLLHYRQLYTMHDRLLGITEYFLLCAVGYAAAMFLSCHTLTCKNHFGSAYVKLSFYLHFEGKTFLRAFVIALNFSANCFSRKRTQWLECKIGYIFINGILLPKLF